MPSKKTPKQKQQSKLAAAVSHNLHKIRTEKNMSQAALAEAAGLSVAYVSLIERGGRETPLATVEKLASGLKVKPSTLLGY